MLPTNTDEVTNLPSEYSKILQHQMDKRQYRPKKTPQKYYNPNLSSCFNFYGILEESLCVPKTREREVPVQHYERGLQKIILFLQANLK